MEKRLTIKKAKQLLKESGAEGIANPTKLINDVMGADAMQQMKSMASGIDDSFMLMQEHLLIVQNNQKAFESYFKATYEKVESLEKAIVALQQQLNTKK